MAASLLVAARLECVQSRLAELDVDLRGAEGRAEGRRWRQGQKVGRRWEGRRWKGRAEDRQFRAGLGSELRLGSSPGPS